MKKFYRMFSLASINGTRFFALQKAALAKQDWRDGLVH
jgi:hypothetical protein